MPLFSPASSGSSFGAWDNILTKTVQQSVENTTTFADDTDLQFTVVAGKTYEIEGIIMYEMSSVANYKWGVIYPALTGANQAVGFRRDLSTGGSIGQTIPQSAVTGQWPGNGGVQIGIDAANRVQAMMFHLVISIVTGGTFKFQFAQGSAGGVGTFARTNPGSSLRYKKLTP